MEAVNGNRSYLETYFEIVDYITMERIKPPSEYSTLFKDIQETSGTCGFWDLAEAWTNEFEAKERGRIWDGEFYEEVEDFCKLKNK